MPAQFVHLHVHSQYSFLLGTIKLDALSRRIRELGMPAVALTDRANMYVAIRHYKYSLAQEIQPILGCEINVVRDDDSASGAANTWRAP